MLREPVEHVAGHSQEGRRWPAGMDAAGKPVKLLFGERKTRQIVYYTNVEFPDDPSLLKTAQEVVGDWNDAFKQSNTKLE